MFETLIWFMRVVLNIAAFLVVLTGILQGEAVAASIGLGNTNSVVYGIAGFIAGASVASILFGVPMVLLNIDRKVSEIVTALLKIEKNTRGSGFASQANVRQDETAT
ncbi:MAG: hypothetical protein LBV45_03440 [Xanthomonadaceae bacterium]|jgi:ABC-type uncharacterized transport system fused permease/ATPase subunit|nr:hypothetical protein [Xanthomonadaceae bacterium]